MTSGPVDPSAAELRQRDVAGDEPEDPSGAKAFYEQSWAAVIGIDGYQAHLNRLIYAVSDAVGIARALISRLGFPARNVFLVLDPPPLASSEDGVWLVGQSGLRLKTGATKEVLEELLFTTLPGCAGPDDRVLVYFAGHGVRRPADGDPRDATPYLVPVDGRRDQWHSYIDLNSLTRQGAYFRAKHVFYLLDACSSGLTGVRTRSDETTSRYEKDLLHRRARQCLTASTAEQPAADAGHGHHSIFTGHVIDVLEGRVQLPGAGLITGQGLISHVKQAVGASDRSRQTPDGFPLEGHEQGDFVFSAPRVPFTLEERAELARRLHADIGLRIDEPSPMELAARLWQRIIDARPADPEQEAEAQLERGRALLALEQLDAAMKLLGDSRVQHRPDALLLLGIARLRARKFADAADALQRFVADHGDHAYAGWARAVLDPRHAPRGVRRALLIGVGKYLKNPTQELRGCENDVRALERTLGDKLGFEPANIQVMIDAAATADSIRRSLAAFQDIARPEDTFVCYLAGNGMEQPQQQTIFASYDVDLEDKIFVTEQEIDDLLTAIPADDKLLIADACHLAPRPDAGPPAYRMLFGSGRKEKTRELFAPEAVSRGAFSYALERALELRGNAPLGELVTRIESELRSRKVAQTPGCSGDPAATLVREDPPVLRVIELADRWSCGRFSLDQVKAFAAWMGEEQLAARPLWSGVGRALLAKHCYAEAAAALQHAEPAATWPSLVRARLMLHDPASALRDAQAGAAIVRATADAETTRSLDSLLDMLGHAVEVKRHVLLAVVGAETPEAWTSDPRALLDQTRRALIGCGVTDDADAVEVVSQVSRSALVAAFAAFARRIGDAPAMFLFIGPGFEDTELWLSSADEAESKFSDLPLSALRELATGCANLVSAVFLTQTRGPRTPTAGAPSGEASTPPSTLLGLGATTVVVAPPRTRDFSDLGPPPPDVPAVVQALAQHAHPALSAEQWVRHAGRRELMSIRGDATTPLFSYREGRRALELLDRIEQAPLLRTHELLTKLTEQRTLAADAWLHRAVVRGALGRHDDALADIRAALIRRHPPVAQDPSATENLDVVPWPEAHYHRGRILLAAGNFAAAEAALKTAIDQGALEPTIDQDRTLARAHYHRVRAIRRLIEANFEQQARESARRYLTLGTPLGLDEDIERFVGQHGERT